MPKHLNACTILSINYFAYAQVLAESFLDNGGERFHILLIDRKENEQYIVQNFDRDRIIIHWVEDLKIDNFFDIAFKFDILELNTNVKPSFLKYLLQKYELGKVVYFDPDIKIFNAVNLIFSELDDCSIILTPHALSPYNDDKRPSDRDLLLTGEYNLGFIGVRNDNNVFAFLDWWSRRCLEQGYKEQVSGLFVDQKWMNLAPCYFSGVKIIREKGWNVAYWNLHERMLENRNGEYFIDEASPLVFFHFSGIVQENNSEISRYQNRYTLQDRKELFEIFNDYRKQLLEKKYKYYSDIPYSFGTYNNGKRIDILHRRLFSMIKESQRNFNPFSENTPLYKWLRQRDLLFIQQNRNISNINSINFNPNRIDARLLNTGFRLLLKILKPYKYQMLLRYLLYISVLRNQKEIFKIDKFNTK